MQQGSQARKRRQRASSTIVQFCRRHQIGRSTYYALRKAGLAPREMRIGVTVRISAKAERDWVRGMEAGQAARLGKSNPDARRNRSGRHEQKSRRKRERQRERSALLG